MNSRYPFHSSNLCLCSQRNPPIRVRPEKRAPQPGSASRVLQLFPEGGSNINFLELTQTRLAALCEATQFDARTALEACETLLGPTGQLRVESSPQWRSALSDDHTPVEFSIALEGGRVEPRLLIESLDDAPTVASSWDAARATNERLRQRYGTPLERLALVEELFRPRRDASFGMWHAAWLRQGRPPLFKVYLNPAANGVESAPALIEEVLGRLGFSRAWSCIEGVVARRPSVDHVIYFSLDLDANPAARVKVYVAHPSATARDIEPLLALSPGYVAGESERFCRALTMTEGPFGARPLQTCYAFTASDDARPSSVTLHLPIRSYTAHDRVALERISNYLGGELGASYRQIIERVAHRPLEAGSGLQTYASLCCARNQKRATVYLAMEAYATHPPRG